MRWKKRGRIYRPDGNEDWRATHAQIPTVDRISDDVFRIFYATRDRSNRTVTTYLDVDAENPGNILYVHDRPVLGLGELGCFDDSGAMPSWVLNHGGRKYLFYIGWNAGVSVSYRNSIGIAVSDDGGRTFERLYRGPVVDRTRLEPHFCATSCVRIENNVWRMWHDSCTGWIIADGKPEPLYRITYAESKDGINWERLGHVCIDYASEKEGGITRPCVIFEDNIYKMWFCYRSASDYRTNRSNSYRLGYAESHDGLQWDRRDDQVGLDVSDDGWDSDMVAYPFVIQHNHQKYLFYCGNGFGQAGFGYAVSGR